MKTRKKNSESKTGFKDNKLPVPNGYKEVFCPYITRNGKRIYPKNARVFRFIVKIKK